ncbi:MAG: NusG domain II-containing protein [Pseudomonadota bacterium]
MADIRPADVLIVTLAIIFCIFLFNKYWFSSSHTVEFISIQIGNQPAKLYPALSHQKIKVQGLKGESEIEIKQGRARFLHSHCIGQQCVFHGWVDGAGRSIVCLPNQISITLIGRDTEFDALNF